MAIGRTGTTKSTTQRARTAAASKKTASKKTASKKAVSKKTVSKKTVSKKAAAAPARSVQPPRRAKPTSGASGRGSKTATTAGAVREPSRTVGPAAARSAPSKTGRSTLDSESIRAATEGASAKPKRGTAEAAPGAKKGATKPGRRGRKASGAVAPGRPASAGNAAGGQDASNLRARFSALASAKHRISGLKRSFGKSFFDVGLILNEIRDERLYEVKGYGSFEAFVERELDLGKVTCLRSARIAETMVREAALAAGLDRASAAVAALDGEDVPPSVQPRMGHDALSTLPPHKR